MLYGWLISRSYLRKRPVSDGFRFKILNPNPRITTRIITYP